MGGALEQALAALNQGKNRIRSNMSIVNKGTLTSALKQAMEMIRRGELQLDEPQKESRRKRGSEPIATLDDGGILYSDGSTRMPMADGEYAGPLDQTKAQILRKNLIDQVAFTPEARQALEDTDWYAYGTRDQSSEFNRSGGVQWGNKVGINVNTLDAPGAWPSRVATHEALHTLDDRLRGTSRTGVSSEGFDDLLKQYEPRTRKAIRDLMHGSGIYDDNKLVDDVESFAYAGDRGPQQALSYSKPVSEQYNRVFVPASQNINYSPVYPIQDVMRELVARLREEDEE